MSTFVLITGVIFRAPTQRTAKTGKLFTTCTVKVGSDDIGVSDYWNILSFSESTQQELLRLEVGDAVSVRGKLKIEFGGDLSQTELAMIKTAAGLAIQAEAMQASIVNGELVNSDDLIRLSSEARRILDAITEKAGKRKPATVPGLHDIVARHSAGRADLEDD